MKIAIFADLHAHPFKDGATIGEYGINSRLQDCIDALQAIYDYCVENKIKNVLFGGDLFHVRKKVDTAALGLVFEVISQYEIVTNAIPGNHDQYDNQGYFHALESLSAIWFVRDKPEWVKLDKNVAVCCIPFMPEKDAFIEALNQCVNSAKKSWHKIGLFHVGIDKTRVGQGRFQYVIDADVDIDDLKPDFWDVIFVGHFHTPQKIHKNVYYIGAPLQHNWADEGEDRGFWVYDTLTGKANHIILEAPRFITVESIDFDQSKFRDKDFIRVIFNERPTEQQVEEMAKANVAKVALKLDNKMLKRSAITTSGSPASILAEFLSANLANTLLDEEFLLESGLRYLED